MHMFIYHKKIWALVSLSSDKKREREGGGRHNERDIIKSNLIIQRERERERERERDAHRKTERRGGCQVSGAQHDQMKNLLSVHVKCTTVHSGIFLENFYNTIKLLLV